MITNYADLQSSIGQWLARSDLASTAPDLIQLAEVRIARDLLRMEHRRLMVSVSGTLVASAAALPADYATVRSVEVPRGGVTVTIPPLDSVQQRMDVSWPAGYWIDGNTLRIVGGGVSPYTLNYFQRLPSLVAAPNWLIVQAPDLYLYATLLEAAPYLRDDDRIGIWREGYVSALGAIEDESNRSKSGPGKRMRTAFNAP